MRTIRNKGLAALATGTLALGLLASAGAASADPAAGGKDIVGVGSDTLQYMLDFGADGDFNGNAGYNAGKAARLVSYDATPDANARAGYQNGSTSAALLPLNPTVTLRGGAQPAQRPNGSGSGINALGNDTGVPNVINFARSSSAISQANVTALNSTVGNVHVLRLAHETLGLGVAKTTNAPALSAAQLKSVYTCASTTWTQVGGTSADTIIPVIPQLGSGTRKTFLTDIGFSVDSAGNATPALGSCVRVDEENNPYALYLDSTGKPLVDPYATSAVANPDAIAPFSGGRLGLYASGYFYNPNVAFGATPPSGDQGSLTPTVQLAVAGTPSDAGTQYSNKRGLYVVFRQADVTSTTHFNGSAKNWVQTLFLDSTTPTNAFFDSAAGQALLSSAGVTPDYADCGMNPTTGAAACGPFVG